jgi:predicted dehydrogenase
VAQYFKYIIVEKPFVLRYRDLSYIQKNVPSDCQFFVCMQNRFNIAVQKANEILLTNKLGKVVCVNTSLLWARDNDYYDSAAWRATWKWDGGVLANQAVHHLDVMDWLGGKIETVSAMSRNINFSRETENLFVARMTMANDSLGILEATTAARPKNMNASISILMERGRLLIHGQAINELKVWDENNPDGKDVVKQEINGDIYGGGHKELYKHVVECIKKGKPSSLIGWDTAERTVLLLNKFYASAEANGDEISISSSLMFSKLLGGE